MNLHAYDGLPSQPQDLFQNVPIEMAKRIILNDIKVINTQLDYNIFLGDRYIYAIKFITSMVFWLIMITHH